MSMSEYMFNTSCQQIESCIMMRFIVFQTVVGLLLVGLWGPPSRAQTSAVILPNPKTGDTYIIEYRDPDNPKLTYSTERTVIAVGEGTITVAAKNLNSKTGKARTLQFTSEW